MLSYRNPLKKQDKTTLPDVWSEKCEISYETSLILKVDT